MKVIMIHDIGGVGRKNDIKNVADGYALNFLIPNGHAVQATMERVKAVEAKVATDKRTISDRDKNTLQGLERLRGAQIRILARANPNGGLYQELSPVAIATAIQSAYGVRVPRESILIPNLIKSVGNHNVTISQGGHTADVRISVVKNGN